MSAQTVEQISEITEVTETIVPPESLQQIPGQRVKEAAPLVGGIAFIPEFKGAGAGDYLYRPGRRAFVPRVHIARQQLTVHTH